MSRDTILIVENDADYRATLRDYLEQIGGRVLEAGNVPAALHEIKMYSPRLILLDMRLVDDNDPHDMSGIKLMRQIPPHIPIIILTAHQDASLVRDAYEAIPHLPKPYAYLFKQEGAEAIRARVLEALQSASPSARPWYRETTFLVLASLAMILILAGGLYVEFNSQGTGLLGIIVVGVLVEVIAAFVLNLLKVGK
jgi:CheY-like chemotaxis protein